MESRAAESLRKLEVELQPLENFLRDIIKSDLPTVLIDIAEFEKAIPERASQAESLKLSSPPSKVASAVC